LNHGEYYEGMLKEYLHVPRHAFVWTTGTPHYIFEQHRKEQEEELKRKIKEKRGHILKLVMECLELQPE
ncbi:MAG: hypothetical protein NOU37_09195, partial [Candidatus Brocadiales bacterium]|nr:hypothetical protein [Candidatus Bathyanammoxibius amoris]